MRKTGHAIIGSAAALGWVTLFTATGCETAIPGFEDFAPGTDAGRQAEQAVTIAFRNLATVDAVDVEFHTTSAPVADLPDGLFIEVNKVTASLGIAGTGLLGPGATDVLELPCDANLIIGTAGGTFLDNETGELAGRGEPRWLDAAAVGLCGAIVGITFGTVGDTFVTTIEIRR